MISSYTGTRVNFAETGRPGCDQTMSGCPDQAPVLSTLGSSLAEAPPPLSLMPQPDGSESLRVSPPLSRIISTPLSPSRHDSDASQAEASGSIRTMPRMSGNKGRSARDIVRDSEPLRIVRDNSGPRGGKSCSSRDNQTSSSHRDLRVMRDIDMFSADSTSAPTSPVASRPSSCFSSRNNSSSSLDTDFAAAALGKTC